MFNILEKKPRTESIPVEVSLLVDTKPQVKPGVVTPLKDQTVIEGENIVLRAEFSSHLPLEYSWFKDEVTVNSSERLNISADGNWAILRINNSNVDDEAEYVCLAANDLGSCETAAELLVDGMSKLIDCPISVYLFFSVHSGFIIPKTNVIPCKKS